MAYTYEFGKWLSSPPPGEEVVISGTSGRFPESNNLREYKENLFNKIDMVTDDNRRWSLDHPEVPKRSGTIYNINKIDAGYFGLHYRQADIMDPMIRKFLECTVEALMDAGINPSELEGTKTAVCVGACYADMEIETLSNINKEQNFAITGYLRSLLAHRISYFLKVKGVSCVSDTACSSSLSAFDVAYKLIRTGKCENAIVGGTNLILHPGVTRQFFRLGVLSSDGTCKVFDEKADGYVKGECIGCILLQKAKNAKRIYSRIIYSKTNCDGFKSLGITYPSIQMQKQLMEEVLYDSGVDPSDLSFMEAHGTGTEVGDPQEVEAIDNAIAKKRTKPLLIGSVKCSVGHAEPSSAFNSIAKIIIALETGYIPPNIHLKNIKKGMVGFEEGRLIPVTELTKLDRDDAIIGINNFGFGGSNCHLLVQRFEKNKINQGTPQDDLPRLVCVSGRTQHAVLKLLEDINNQPLDSEYIGLLHQIFKKDIQSNLYRGYTIVSKSGLIKTGLKHTAKKKPLHLIFGKLESDYKVLYQHLSKFECFKSSIKRVNNVLVEEFNKNKNKIKTLSEKDNKVFSSFAVQIGIVDVLKFLELEPTAVYGYSFGKIVSSYYYENITLEETINALCTHIYTSENKNENFESIIAESNFQDYRADFSNYERRAKVSKNSIILNMSDDSKYDEGSFYFVKNKQCMFLEILGRLYIEGYNFQVHKLYPEIQFPVSRSTPVIAPSIHWNYTKTWYTYKFGEITETDITQQGYNLSSTLYEEQKYLLGHVIDGRNLVPAIEYLQLVMRTYERSFGMAKIDNIPFVFENCKFTRALTLAKEVVQLLVSVQKSSGNFEIVEKNSIVATGRIYVPENIKEHEIDLPTNEISENKTKVLEQDEIYRELYLRGYNYSGEFKSIAKCNIDGSAALIKWNNNFTTFLDNMLQMKIFQLNTRSLYVPIGIKKVIINPLKHAQFTEKQEDHLCPAYSCKASNIIKSGGIEIHGIQATAILRKKSTAVPVLEKHVFIPNVTQISLDDSLRVITQIILENSLENNFKSVEILDDSIEANYQLLSPLISKALDDLPSILVNLTVSSKNQLEVPSSIKIENITLTPSSNLLLIVATKMFQRPTLLTEALNALSPTGFLLTRENLDFSSENLENIEVLSEHFTNNEKLILFRKQKEIGKTAFIEIMKDNFKWLPELQKVLKEDVDIVIHSQNSEPEGVLGLVNCLRREPQRSKVRCFFMMEPTPKFDIEDPLFIMQLRKKMAVNIYKNGKWGTYRHLLLDDEQEVQGAHFFVKNTIKGDLSSLKWVEGNLTTKTKLEEGSVLVFPFYSSLNFKDIMIASGRVSVDSFTTDRIAQECCLGFEFSGIDSKGRRVMGMIERAAIATMAVANEDFLWKISDDWSFQDASTVVVVYATVIYGLFKVITIKPGMSILIHSATGGVGLAAINICLHYGLDIFVTVGTKEKREYLKKHFPQIPENHIGNSRDESFEKMIETETKGRGVDIVLNSLSEEKLRASVRCVAPGGNFLEIGKYDLGNDASFALLLLERNVSYHGVMLDRLFENSPALKAWLQDQIYKGLKRGYVKPLPITVFKRDEIVQAYKYMTTGKHMGKVIIQVRDENENIVKIEKQIFKGVPRFTCDPKKVYIILGGLGGFGLELADWLYLRGAKKIILVSRQGIQTGYQKQRIRIWTSCGVSVHISTASITKEEGCLELIKEANKLGPVDAIFNLAVVLKDALFEEQNQETFIASLAPKAQATIHLDKITRRYCPQLKYFVVFSSVSCGRGNPGQTNYGMANSIMERICERRKNEGLPGLAIQWGAIGEVGLVARMQKENKELVIGGTLQQKISSCLEVLDKFLKQDNPIVSSMVVAEKNNRISDLKSAADVVAYILGIKDIKAVNHHATLAELGMDSMMGTEMIQILEKDHEIYLTAKEVRNLTFAKLIEIETEKKKKDDVENIIEKSTNVLLQYIPREKVEDLPIEKISNQPKDEENATTVILLPGIEGVFTGMEIFTQNLKANILGIHYINHSSTSSVEGYAQMILPHIEETVSKQGTFTIISYSFGTLIAIELTKFLEEKGFTGRLIVIEGAPNYLAAVARANLPDDKGTESQTFLLLKVIALVVPIEILIKDKKKYFECKNFDQIFEFAKTQAPPGLFEKENIEKQAVLSLYNRLVSVINYKFNHKKIKSQVHLFKAKHPMLSDFADDYQLSELCELPVKVEVVDGDHGTILKQDQLFEVINGLLKVE